MGFFRMLLFLMLGYLLWKVFRIVSRVGGFSFRRYGSVHKPPESRKPEEQKITNATDAEFEEIPPSETDKD